MRSCVLFIFAAYWIHAIQSHTLNKIHQCSSHHHTIIKGINLFEQQTSYKNHPYSQPRKSHEHDAMTQRRSLLSDVSPIRISAYYDPITFIGGLSAANQTYVKHLIGAIADYYKNAVSVVPIDAPIHFDRPCFGYVTPFGIVCTSYSAQRCGEIELPSSHLSEQYEFDDFGTRTMLPSGLGIADTDLVLYVSANESSRFCGPGTLAHAGPCFVDQYGRPIAGSMNICSRFWVGPTWHEDVEVLLHEMTHVTIMADDLWATFKDASGNTIPVEQVLDDTPSSREIISPIVKAKVQQHFNCPTATGLPLDVYDSAHWNERYVFSEVMNPSAFSTQTYYTEFTLAFLEDSGWYAVNYEYAEPFAFGKDAGCAYFTGDCVDPAAHTSNFPLYYCDSPGDVGCNADYSNPSRCYYGSYPEIPSEYQYFAVSTEGGSAASDYCPWRTPWSDRSVCWDTTSTAPLSFAEIYEGTSRCTRLTDTRDSAQYGFCFSHTCNGWDGAQYTGVDIKVTSTDTISCSRAEAFSIKAVPSTSVFDLQCPDIDIVCGTTSHFGECYWGHYSDMEAQCVCSPGFTGTDCNTVNDAIDADVTYPVSKAPTSAPSVQPEVCFQDWDAVDSAFNGAWTNTGEYYDLGTYTNAANLALYFGATHAHWFVSVTVGVPMLSDCLCNVSIYTDNIGDCSTNWYCNSIAIPLAKTYYGSCMNPAPTTPAPTTQMPTVSPTVQPTQSPSKYPTQSPTKYPTHSPTKYPTRSPTRSPSVPPSTDPTQSPITPDPSRAPTLSPTTKAPTGSPITNAPTLAGVTMDPSASPTVFPTRHPTAIPSQDPSVSPSEDPTASPSENPTVSPSQDPSVPPSKYPSQEPTASPSDNPTVSPSQDPTASPSQDPSISPSKYPTITGQTRNPSASPSVSPSKNPTGVPTKAPQRTGDPTSVPTEARTAEWMSCIPRTELFNGNGHIEIEIDEEEKKMKIIMSGPPNQWFGVGFGSTVMKDTYAIIVDGQNVAQRILGHHIAGQVLLSPPDEQKIDSEVTSKIEAYVVRPWAADLNVGGSYDFSDFFEGKMCDRELPIIWALGESEMFVGHSHKDNSLVLRSCICTEMPTDSTSDAPTMNPTPNPATKVANSACGVALWFEMFFVSVFCAFFVF